MKNLLLFSFCIFQCSLAICQVDSTLIKLQQYKSFYAVGLIDSEEYLTLKAKLLGIKQTDTEGSRQEDPKAKNVDTEIFYDVAKTDEILPNGLYMNMEEIKSRKPSFKCNMTITLRNTYDYENGVSGNVILKAIDQCVSKKALKMDAWIYSDGIRGYINLEQLKLEAFYNPIITMGRFLAFYKNQTANGVDIASAWGGSIGTEIAQATGNYFKKLYVIDTRTSMLFPVNNEYMLKVLKDYPTLHSKYLGEKDFSDNRLYAKYIQAMNDIE